MHMLCTLEPYRCFGFFGVDFGLLLIFEGNNHPSVLSLAILCTDWKDLIFNCSSFVDVPSSVRIVYYSKLVWTV